MFTISIPKVAEGLSINMLGNGTYGKTNTVVTKNSYKSHYSSKLLN